MSDRVIIPYVPRPLQQQIHDNLKRFNVLVLHRRFGKTVLAVNQIIKDLIQCELPAPRGAYIAPFRQQAKRVAWDYAKLFTSPIPGRKVYEAELKIEWGDTRLYIDGADNADAHRGVYLDTLALDETAQIAPTVWSQILRPTLADRKGRLLAIGTPKGRSNTFHRMFETAAEAPDWYRILLRAEDTGHIDADELIAARREMGEDEFNQEFNCSWSAALKGAYYGAEIMAAQAEGRITRVPYDKTLPVYTSWDLGVANATIVVFWQAAGAEIRVIDCQQFTGQGLPDIWARIRALPYQLYEEHIGPHDLRVKELGSGQTRYEIAAGLGLVFTICRNIPIMDGIESVRNVLSRCWFDAEKCAVLIDALSQYRADYDELRQVYKTAPLHDWTSDYADAVRYFAVSMATGQRRSWAASLDYSLADRAVI